MLYVGRSKDLLGRSSCYCDVKRRASTDATGSVRKEGFGASEEFLGITCTDRPGEFEIMEPSHYLRPQFICFGEPCCEMAPLPILDVLNEALLVWLEVDAVLDEDQHRAAVTRLEILLMGRGATTFLFSSVSRAQEENDNVGLANSCKAGLFRRIGRRAKIFGTRGIVSQRSTRLRRRITKFFETTHY